MQLSLEEVPAMKGNIYGSALFIRTNWEADRVQVWVHPSSVSLIQAENYQPFVEQSGNQASFPSNTTGPFALTGTVVRYVAIGGTPILHIATALLLSICAQTED